MIDNYIYLYHIKQFIVIPTFPDSLTDTIGVNFNKSTPMSRSAPIYSYSDSGPRSIQINLDLQKMIHIMIFAQIITYNYALQFLLVLV